MIEYDSDITECTHEITIKKSIDTVLKHFDLENFLVEVLVTDGETIKNLNKDFRGIDKTTDVLSFPNFEDVLQDSSVKNQYLGSIAISYSRCIEQAKEYNHSIKREIAFLTVHGMLHLLGYDHMNEEDEKEMKEIAYNIMNKLDISRED